MSASSGRAATAEPRSSSLVFMPLIAVLKVCVKDANAASILSLTLPIMVSSIPSILSTSALIAVSCSVTPLSALVSACASSSLVGRLSSFAEISSNFPLISVSMPSTAVL